MNIVVTNDYKEMSIQSAKFIVKNLLKDNKKISIGLATGNTPTGMYEVLIPIVNLGIFDDRIFYYNIDEYCNIDLNKNGTCKKYLLDNFYNKVSIKEQNIYFLDELNYKNYDSVISDFGGFDVLILGIGKNGHIAYNEPGTSFNSLTHIQELSIESKRQHEEDFGSIENVPEKAVTIGIKTIMNSKSILLMASGKEKAEIIKKSLKGDINEQVPASVLQLHPNLHVVLDKEAASLL